MPMDEGVIPLPPVLPRFVGLSVLTLRSLRTPDSRPTAATCRLLPPPPESNMEPEKILLEPPEELPPLRPEATSLPPPPVEDPELKLPESKEAGLAF